MSNRHGLIAGATGTGKTVKAVADSFRSNPAYVTQEVVTQLGTGEVLVSVLDEKGAHTPVERVLISPPESQISSIASQVSKY